MILTLVYLSVGWVFGALSANTRRASCDRPPTPAAVAAAPSADCAARYRAGDVWRSR